jgi:hypothetical protein
MVDHTIVQAVYQAASNVDGTSNEAGTNAKEMIMSPEVNDAQGTPISALKQSPIAAESKLQDIQDVSVAETTTNVAESATPNDTTPNTTHVEKEADEMLTSS